MASMRDPTVEPVTPHPDSLPPVPPRRRRIRTATLIGAVLAVVLTVNAGLMVALAFGSPDSEGPSVADVIARWNSAVADPDLRLAETTNLCGRDGATVAEIVKIRGVCADDVISQLFVEVSRSAGRSQEMLDTLAAMFGDATRFDTAATGLTFDITVRRPRLIDPAESLPSDGAVVRSGSSDRFYERPGVMYGGSMALILAAHVVAHALRSRYWPALLVVSLGAWSAVLLADVRLLSSGRVLASLVAVTVGAAAFNLIGLADQAPPPGPTNLSLLDLRPPPPEIDLTLEPPPLSPRWGARGDQPRDREDQPPRIL